MGLIDTLSLFGTVVLAIPIALLGVEFLVFGDRPVMGAVFLGLAAVLVLGRYYLPDVKGELLGGASDVVLGDPADPGDGAGTGGDGAAGTDGESRGGIDGESTSESDDETADGIDGESTGGSDGDSVSIPDAEAGE